MIINLPNKTAEALEKLSNESKGMIFDALLCHAQGQDIEEYEKAMTPEAFMAYQFLAMWNDAQREKYQNKRIKYNVNAHDNGV